MIIIIFNLFGDNEANVGEALGVEEVVHGVDGVVVGFVVCTHVVVGV